MSYDERYYHANAQDGDRPALLMYERFWRRYLGQGPVLEFGCGVGFFARRLERHTDVFGLETNQYALQKMQEVAPKTKALSDTQDLEDESIGSIVSLHVFEHISDQDLIPVGTELNRILQPGGRILAVMPDLHGRAHALKGTNWSAFSDPTHINLKGADEWERFFSEIWNLRVLDRFADGYYDFPYRRPILLSLFGESMRAARTLLQFLLARPLLSRGDGENIVFIMEKQS